MIVVFFPRQGHFLLFFRFEMIYVVYSSDCSDLLNSLIVLSCINAQVCIMLSVSGVNFYQQISVLAIHIYRVPLSSLASPRLFLSLTQRLWPVCRYFGRVDFMLLRRGLFFMFRVIHKGVRMMLVICDVCGPWQRL